MKRLGQGSAWRTLGLGLLIWAAAMHVAQAHKGSDAYLDIRQQPDATATTMGQVAGPVAPMQELQLVLSVALRDLDQVVAVDANGDARITWGEVRLATPQLLHVLDQAVRLEAGAGGKVAPSRADAGTVAAAPDCALHWRADGLERRGDGSYFRVAANARCPRALALSLHYTLFRTQDASHRLLVAGHVDGTDLLSTMSPQQVDGLTLRDASPDGIQSTGRSDTGRWSTMRAYFLLGMHHLLQGYDHLAFLLALVLPLRLRLWQRPALSPQDAPAQTGQATAGRSNWFALLRTITAFTVGHSVTLALATLGLTQASPAWVEPLIALSIAITAGLNLRPVPGLRVEWLALGFGMVHGYGFAGLLLEAAAPDGLLGWALAGFNLGVEAGQLFAVAAWVLLAHWVVTRRWYVPVVVRGGSVLLIGLATAWFWQRIA